MRRRCGWLEAAKTTPAKVVWSGKRIATDVCPKSLITARSIGWIEEFFVWRKLGLSLSTDMNARQAEAFLILQEELWSEQRDGRP